MSVSLHVVAFRPADEKWNAMKTVWESCTKAGIRVPDDVEKFFDYEKPGDKPGMDVPIKDAMKEWDDDYRQGYEIDLTKLPKDVRYIRAYLS